MTIDETRAEIEAFIRKFGFPDSVINEIVGLKDEDNMISIPLTDKAWKRARSIISAKQVALLDAHTDEADGLNDAVNTALLYLSREPEKSIVLELAERARLQQTEQSASLKTRTQAISEDFHSLSRGLNPSSSYKQKLSSKPTKEYVPHSNPKPKVPPDSNKKKNNKPI